MMLAAVSCSFAEEGGLSAQLSSDHFKLSYDPGVADGKKIANLLELAYIHFHSLYSDFAVQEPAEKLQWMIFSDADAFCRYAYKTEKQDLSWLRGYYSAGTNRVSIVMPETMSTWKIETLREEHADRRTIVGCPPDAETDLAKIIHEVAHQLSFNSGLQKRKVLYPVWASEGLAMYFERNFLSEYFESSCYTTIRLRRLEKLHKQGKLIPLNMFISMSSCDGVNAADAYAQAWGLFHFLHEEYADSLKLYFSNLFEIGPGWKDDEILRNEFIRAFGSPDQLDSKWKRFLEQLSSKS